MTTRSVPFAMAVLALASCADPDDDGDPAALPLAQYELLAPDGFEELIPTKTVEVAWAVEPGPRILRMEAIEGDRAPVTIYDGAVQAAALQWDGRDVDTGAAAAPGNYQVRARVVNERGGEYDSRLGDNAHLIVIQGVTFRDATLAFTGAQATRDVVLTTTARSVMELTLALDPDVATAGDELPLLTATIPGEFASFARSYPFTGRTAADQPIAAGTYVVAAQLRAVAAGVAYRVDGPTLTWTP